MTDVQPTFRAADETSHPFDPTDWSWNESWLFTWIDLDGGPSGFFRIGVLPNQARAMLWSFVHVDGRWLGVEESVLHYDHFDFANGVAYDQWGLRFAWEPKAPLRSGRFTCAGTHLTRASGDPETYVPLSIDLELVATSEPVGTPGMEPSDEVPYPASRFEQSFTATGTVIVDGVEHAVRAGAHRDHSWGPRDWRMPFALGDVQAGDRQLYFVGAPTYGIGMGYIREGDAALEHIRWVDLSVDFDDDAHTIRPSVLRFERADGSPFAVTIEAATPSIAFDIAHASPEPKQWLYWRNLVTATVDGWEGSHRGWFEANRYEPPA